MATQKKRLFRVLTFTVLLYTCLGRAALGAEQTRGIGVSDLLSGLDLSALTQGLAGAGSAGGSAASDAGSLSSAGSFSDLSNLLQLLGVTSREMKDCKVSSIKDQTYTGSAITPTPVVTYNGTRLKKGTDYKISYSNNTKVGTARVRLTGMGSYTGSKSVSFQIVRKNSAAKKGSGSAKKTGSSGKTTKTAQKQHFTVKLSKTSYTYSGKVCKPQVTVTVSKKKVDQKDYTVSYKDHKNVGKATVTVKGKGTYKGYTGEATFRITLKKPALTGATSPQTGVIKASWKKDSQAEGYQLQCATNKTFTSNVKKVTVKDVTGTSLSRTLEKLGSGKKYYVQIRSFKKVGASNWYSEWSSAKTVQVK